MKIRVRVTPRSKRVEWSGPDDEGLYHARIHAPPVDGKANEAVIQLIAERFDVAPSRIRLISGESSRLKTFELPDSLS